MLRRRPMRLERLFLPTMRYADGSWARPFGGREGAGFGSGDGTVLGDVLQGTVRWANAPRRREDGASWSFRRTRDPVGASKFCEREDRSSSARGAGPNAPIHAVVEVGGIEPPSPGDRSGLLRAQPAGRSRLEAPTGGGPLGQPGFDVRLQPPGGAVTVSLLTTPILPSQAAGRGRLPSYLGSERVIVIGACVGPGFSRGIRGPRPASPERFSLRSKPVHPHIRLCQPVYGCAPPG
jgi:hypothetical protein